MDKIIAKQVNPEYVDFSFYFDDDCFTESAGGIQYAVFINATRNSYGYNMEDYNKMLNIAEDVMNGFDNILNKDFYGYVSYKDVMECNNIEYNSSKCKKLKAWAFSNDPLSIESMAEFLTIYTDFKWEVSQFCGYCQSDWCEILYCTDIYNNESIKEIGEFWLGCGAEFIIDDCGGYFITDDILWKGGEVLRNRLSEYSGYKAEELEIYLYKDTSIRKTDNYEIME